MAGSRLEKLGSIFTRVQGLLRSGAMKYEDKPLWVDVFKRFPPKINPVYHREAPQDEVKSLIYSEDFVRARFFNEFTHNPDVVDLTDDNKKLLISQRFIQKYNAFKTDKTTDDAAFDMAKQALKTEGVFLKSVEDIRKEEGQKMKEEAKQKQRLSHSGSLGTSGAQLNIDGVQQGVKHSFSAADIFGNSAKPRSVGDDSDLFVDEEFLDSEGLEELLRAPGAEDDIDHSRKHVKSKPKPNVKH